ncbi:unnamed protein product, partial [Rotaria sp. Silwood2]
MSDEINQSSNITTGNQNESRDLAVCVECAWKNYGYWWKYMIILHDVILHVPTEVIYGLLDPSGCDKATLLRCIVGRLQLNRDEVTALNERP